VLITLAVDPILRPSAGFMLAHPARFIALGFGTGLSPFAPGTVGTLLGFPVYWLVSAWLAPYGPLALLALIAAMFLLGVWACARTGSDLGVADHSGMNWDEIVAFQLVLMMTPAAWQWQAFAFFGFRLFDVLKPPPIRQVDARLKGGLGVMLDDILAAFYTLLAMAVCKTALG
ncbi:MAG TPA: phosphatidylglycerophosphatase A, partial [Burkholderiales bacterium]|nr:phosphatidylglycerophosphatase A [Burkholderiales bacterium]